MARGAKAMLLLEGLMLSREMRRGLRIDQTRHWRNGEEIAAGRVPVQLLPTSSSLFQPYFLFIYFIFLTLFFWF